MEGRAESFTPSIDWDFSLMGDYSNKQGGNVVSVIQSPPQVQQNIDVSAIANAVAVAVTANIAQNMSGLSGGQTVGSGESEEFVFDDSRIMEKLADNMIVDRGNNDSNFSGLGNTEITERDQSEVDSTINLLSGLDD
jgi:hypothetical protein